MYITPVSFSIYNGVYREQAYIESREQGTYYDRNLFTQVLCSYRIGSSIEKQIGYFVASLALPKNHFFRHWLQDTVVYPHPSSTHRVTYITSIVAPSRILSMVINHWGKEGGGGGGERREGGMKVREGGWMGWRKERRKRGEEGEKLGNREKSGIIGNLTEWSRLDFKGKLYYRAAF